MQFTKTKLIFVNCFNFYSIYFEYLKFKNSFIFFAFLLIVVTGKYLFFDLKQFYILYLPHSFQIIGNWRCQRPSGILFFISLIFFFLMIEKKLSMAPSQTSFFLFLFPLLSPFYVFLAHVLFHRLLFLLQSKWMKLIDVFIEFFLNVTIKTVKNLIFEKKSLKLIIIIFLRFLVLTFGCFLGFQ